MYILHDFVLGTKMLFNDLKEVHEYLSNLYTAFKIKLSENKRGGWDVKYLDGIEWLQMLTWEVTKLQENENVS